jgi:cytochrome c peroxidase
MKHAVVTKSVMRLILLSATVVIVSACNRQSPPVATRQSEPGISAVARAAAIRLDTSPAPLSAIARLGQKMFFDASLSGSGKMSCASCHNPAHAYAPANSLAAQLGGSDMKQQGDRAVPSLTYLERTPPFRIRPDTTFDPDDHGPAKAPRPLVNSFIKKVELPNYPHGMNPDQAVPQGGMDWDGRAATVLDQPSGPLFDPREMANRNARALLTKVKATPYAHEFVAVFGQEVFRSQARSLADVYLALARYLAEDRSFHPYNSKFDYYLAGRAQLSEQELRGLKLFDDPKKGNCAACHLDKPTKNRFAPVFTDYEFEALAAPRNKKLTVNRDSKFFDEGACGPARRDLAKAQNFCGLFKTPTLRNVATRQVFFHNGVFHSLEDVVRFYVERETRPEKWYPRKDDGTVGMYDDLPPSHRANVDVSDAPFNGHRGDRPALNDQEITDVVAFLKTLTDNYEDASRSQLSDSRRKPSIPRPNPLKAPLSPTKGSFSSSRSSR